MIAYVGPTILGVATQNTVYDRVPDSIVSRTETAPYLASLCVPIGELSEACKQIREKRGAYYTFYVIALGFVPGQN